MIHPVIDDVLKSNETEEVKLNRLEGHIRTMLSVDLARLFGKIILEMYRLEKKLDKSSSPS